MWADRSLHCYSRLRCYSDIWLYFSFWSSWHWMKIKISCYWWERGQVFQYLCSSIWRLVVVGLYENSIFEISVVAEANISGKVCGAICFNAQISLSIFLSFSLSLVRQLTTHTHTFVRSFASTRSFTSFGLHNISTCCVWEATAATATAAQAAAAPAALAASTPALTHTVCKWQSLMAEPAEQASKRRPLPQVALVCGVELLYPANLICATRRTPSPQQVGRRRLKTRHRKFSQHIYMQQVPTWTNGRCGQWALTWVGV